MRMFLLFYIKWSRPVQHGISGLETGNSKLEMKKIAISMVPIFNVQFSNVDCSFRKENLRKLSS
jgi:hypothetical protein